MTVGALGGLLVAIVAPRFLNDIYEFHLSAVGAIILCLVTAVSIIVKQTNSLDLRTSSDTLLPNGGLSIGKLKSSGFSYLTTIAPLVFIFAGVFVLAMLIESIDERRKQNGTDSVLEVGRNDYGVL